MNLLECYIAGLPHRQPPLTPEQYPPVGAEVRLEPEPENKFDPNAIKVFWGDVFLGYIPKVETPTCRHFGFERGTMKVTGNNGKKWKEITIVKSAEQEALKTVPQSDNTFDGYMGPDPRDPNF